MEAATHVSVAAPNSKCEYANNILLHLKVCKLHSKTHSHVRNSSTSMLHASHDH